MATRGLSKENLLSKNKIISKIFYFHTTNTHAQGLGQGLSESWCHCSSHSYDLTWEEMREVLQKAQTPSKHLN